MKKAILTVMLCAAMVGIAACGSDQSESAPAETTQEKVAESTTMAPEATTEAAAPEIIPVKTETQVGDWSIKVKGSEVSDRIDADYSYFEPDEGNVYYVIDVEATNNGKQAASFLSTIPLDGELSVKLIYGDGYEFTQNNLIGYDQNLVDEVINPLTSKKGKIVFEVPKDITETSETFVLRFSVDNTDYTFAVKK